MSYLTLEFFQLAVFDNLGLSTIVRYKLENSHLGHDSLVVSSPIKPLCYLALANCQSPMQLGPQTDGSTLHDSKSRI